MTILPVSAASFQNMMVWSLLLLVQQCGTTSSNVPSAGAKEDWILDLHRHVLAPEQLDALHTHLRGGDKPAVSHHNFDYTASRQREMSMGDGWNDNSGGMMNGGDGGMMNGGGSGSGGMGNSDAHGVIMSLLNNADLIDRVVYPLYNDNSNGTKSLVGVETYTTSQDDTVASHLQLHVSQMETLLSNGGRIRYFDPLFATLEDQYNQTMSQMENIDRGVHVWHAGVTQCAAALVEAHSSVVTAFVENGYSEMMQTHNVPDICNSGQGSDSTGFTTFETTQAGSTSLSNTTHSHQDSTWDIPCVGDDCMMSIPGMMWDQYGNDSDVECNMMTMWNWNQSYGNLTCDSGDSSCMGAWFHGDNRCPDGINCTSSSFCHNQTLDSWESGMHRGNYSSCEMSMMWQWNHSFAWNRSCDDGDTSCVDPWYSGNWSCPSNINCSTFWRCHDHSRDSWNSSDGSNEAGGTSVSSSTSNQVQQSGGEGLTGSRGLLVLSVIFILSL